LRNYVRSLSLLLLLALCGCVSQHAVATRDAPRAVFPEALNPPNLPTKEAIAGCETELEQGVTTGQQCATLHSQVKSSLTTAPPASTGH
jgi:hypothetical protein